MNQKNLSSKLMNVFKHDKQVWYILAAVSALILMFSGYSLPKSLIYIGIGISGTVIVSHVPHKYFKMCTLPLSAITVTLIVGELFLAPEDGRWLLLGSIPLYSLLFVSLTLCMLLTAIAMAKDSKQKMIGMLALIAICILSYANDISYASVLTTTTVLGMLLLGIYRKTVIRFLYVLIFVNILFIGSAFLLGRTIEEHRDDTMTQKVELPSALQNRFDGLKEYMVNVFASGTVEDTHVQIETEVDKHVNNNILASSYHNIYKHTGVWGCIAISVLYIFLLYRVVYRLEFSNSKFAKCLALCCSIALVVDSIYNACMAGTSNIHIATTAMTQYVMFGIILSCLSSCEKTNNNRVKALFKTMIEV